MATTSAARLSERSGLQAVGATLVDIRRRQPLEQKQFHAKCSVALFYVLLMDVPELVCCSRRMTSPCVAHFTPLCTA
jgi:hypothetical protein